uniref:Uncharacterized protein n=1 Tax=Solanum tuberosum TaxID=4113 RepID=M1DYI9_SOLTU
MIRYTRTTHATKKLRSMGITTMIVRITTPDDNEEYRKQFMEVVLDEYYEKPLTKEILQALLRKFLTKFRRKSKDKVIL